MAELLQRKGWTQHLTRGAAFAIFGLSMAVAGARDGGMGTVPLSGLPVQAQQTHALVLAGGPFPYAKDGTVFGNRERLLPRKSRGYYREYTVRTPGSKTRGARRLVCGGEPPTKPDACYYTEDHYASYRQVLTR